jgi:uncharacterized protein DUF445
VASPLSPKSNDGPPSPDARGAERVPPPPAGGDAPAAAEGDDAGILPQARAETRARAHDLWTLVKKYGARHAPSARLSPSPARVPPPVNTPVAALRYLRLTPALLTALFAVSFAWDFPGVSVSLWGRTVALDGLLLVLSVSGLIGFLTNWVAVTMLFQPRRRRPIFGQGLIPAQRERVISKLAQTISDNLINPRLIHQQIEDTNLIPRSREAALHVVRGVIEDPEFRGDLKRLVTDYVGHVVADTRVREELVRVIIRKMEQQATGVSGVVLSLLRHFKEEELYAKIDAAIRELPGSLDQVLDRGHYLLDTIPGKLEARSAEIEEWVTQAMLHIVQQLDVYGLLIANMSKYDEAQLEDLLKNTSNEQFNYIKYLGGVLGFFGGLVIWQPVPALILFGVLAVVLLLADEALVRIRKRRGTE